MSPASRVLELFRSRPTGSNRVDWLADQLLALAVEVRFLSMCLVPDEGGGEWTLAVADSDRRLSAPDAGPVRLFRTLLARFAKMGEEETGAVFNPYGGKLHFDRNGPTGPDRVNVEFGNTAGVQSLTLVCSTRSPGCGTAEPTGISNSSIEATRQTSPDRTFDLKDSPGRL